jgi:protocatechuate 3,4-dioxygenase beta subunit
MLRLVLFCLLPVAIFAQDASLTLAGNVVDLQSGQPLVRVLVTIRGFPKQKDSSAVTSPQPISRSALTDAGGGFRFSTLPAGYYSVSAQKTGYEFGLPAVSRLGTGMVDLQSPVEDVRVALSAYGDITGKVLDDHGEPMRGVSIHALSSQVVDGLTQTRSVRTVNTDDRGQYRISSLSPGKYFLKATGQGGANLLSGAANTARLDVGDSFAPVYFGGGVTVGSASPVEISSGTHATADFVLKIEPAWRLRAMLRNFNPREQVTFTLVIAGEEVPAGPDRANSETGALEFKDVVSGAYILRAVQSNATGEVAVNLAGADTENAVLVLYPAVDIPVTVRFTNPVGQAFTRAAKRPRLADDDNDDDDIGVPADVCNVFLTPLQNGSARAVNPVLGEDGILHNVVAGKQRVSIQCFDGYVRSALEGTQDLLADPVVTILPGTSPPPIEIVATHGGGTLTAKLDSGILRGRTGIQVLLVPKFSGATGPEHREGDFGASGAANQYSFVFAGLAPGTYAMYAFSNLNNEYRNPEFLKSLSGGQAVQIDEGAEKEISIDKVLP